MLAPWGVDERAERLYRTALRHPGSSLPELAVRLGWNEDTARRSARLLLLARLVRQVGDALIPAPPAAALEGLLDREDDRLQARLRQVADARTAISGFVAEHLAGRSARWDHEPLEVLEGDAVLATVGDLARTTVGELRCLHTVLGMGAEVDPELRRLSERQLQAGREMRSIYPASVLEDRQQAEHVHFWAARGERSRLVPAVPHAFVVFGDEAALVPAVWGRAGDRILVVRTPVLVAAFRELFDLLWARAASLPRRSGENGAEDERAKILQLLAVGGKDETVARQLGISLRTVRRRVAELMEELGASTRFQAGMEAARRGLV